MEAPLQWYLTIANFLESVGGERQFSDPCVWGFFDEQRKPIAWASGHVDDFMFSGNPKNPKWLEIRKKIQERFPRGSWEADKFVQCGVLIESLPNHGFHLSQPDYLDSLQEIQINRSRWKDLEAQITSHELQQLRSILGGLSWHASQVAPQLSAAVSLLLSKLHQGTVQTMVETNRLLRKGRALNHQKMVIHAFEPHEKPVIFAWVDAAHAKRVDGSSTKGVLIGWSSTGLLEGNLRRVSPLYWHSARIQRVCRSSAASETRAAVDAEDELYAVRFQVFEYLGGQVSVWRCDDAVTAVDGVLVSDSKNLYDRVSQTVLTLKGAWMTPT